jgi:hypothetical protein
MHGDWQEALDIIIYQWEGLKRRNTTVMVQSVYSQLAIGPIKELNQALAQALKPILTTAPILMTAPMPTTTLIPKLPPATVPKKIIYIEARIKAQFIKEGEVTKQIIYILIA